MARSRSAASACARTRCRPTSSIRTAGRGRGADRAMPFVGATSVATCIAPAGFALVATDVAPARCGQTSATAAEQTFADTGELQPDLRHLVVLQAAHHQHRVAEREPVADLGLFVETLVEQVRSGRLGEARRDG